MANPFVHIELQTKDLAKAKDFYSRLFDWKLEDVPAPGGDLPYTLINVGEGTGGVGGTVDSVSTGEHRENPAARRDARKLKRHRERAEFILRQVNLIGLFAALIAAAAAASSSPRRNSTA